MAAVTVRTTSAVVLARTRVPAGDRDGQLVHECAWRACSRAIGSPSWRTQPPAARRSPDGAMPDSRRRTLPRSGSTSTTSKGRRVGTRLVARSHEASAARTRRPMSAEPPSSVRSMTSTRPVESRSPASARPSCTERSTASTRSTTRSASVSAAANEAGRVSASCTATRRTSAHVFVVADAADDPEADASQQHEDRTEAGEHGTSVPDLVSDVEPDEGRGSARASIGLRGPRHRAAMIDGATEVDCIELVGSSRPANPKRRPSLRRRSRPRGRQGARPPRSGGSTTRPWCRPSTFRRRGATISSPAAATTSRLAVGSSNRSTGGECTRARPSDTFWRLPFDSSRQRSVEQWAQPEVLGQPVDRRPRRLRCPVRGPRR